MESTDARLYSAGDCPLCSDCGMLALVVSLADQSVLFACPICGVVWKSPPDGKKMPSNDTQWTTIEEVARGGLRLPTDMEVRAEIAKGTPLQDEDFSYWGQYISEYLVDA